MVAAKVNHAQTLSTPRSSRCINQGYPSPDAASQQASNTTRSFKTSPTKLVHPHLGVTGMRLKPLLLLNVVRSSLKNRWSLLSSLKVHTLISLLLLTLIGTAHGTENAKGIIGASNNARNNARQAREAHDAWESDAESESNGTRWTTYYNENGFPMTFFMTDMEEDGNLRVKKVLSNPRAYGWCVEFVENRVTTIQILSSYKLPKAGVDYAEMSADEWNNEASFGDGADGPIQEYQNVYEYNVENEKHNYYNFSMEKTDNGKGTFGMVMNGTYCIHFHSQEWRFQERDIKNCKNYIDDKIPRVISEEAARLKKDTISRKQRQIANERALRKFFKEKYHELPKQDISGWIHGNVLGE
jgi:hypothetical protein